MLLIQPNRSRLLSQAAWWVANRDKITASWSCSGQLVYGRWGGVN